MATKKAKQSEFSVTLTAVDYRTNTYFNRFQIERLDGHALLSFGFVHRDEILSSYAILLEDPTIKQSKEGMLKYLGEQGAPDSEAIPWTPAKSSLPPSERRMDVSNYMQLSRIGDIGEIRFGIFSIGAGLDRVRREATKVELNASGLALLRCPLEVQKHLLIQLYEKDAGV